MVQKQRKCIWCKHAPAKEREFCPNCGTYQAVAGEFKDDGRDDKCIFCGAENQADSLHTKTFCSKCGRRLLHFRSQNKKLN